MIHELGLFFHDQLNAIPRGLSPIMKDPGIAKIALGTLGVLGGAKVVVKNEYYEKIKRTISQKLCLRKPHILSSKELEKNKLNDSTHKCIYASSSGVYIF